MCEQPPEIQISESDFFINGEICTETVGPVISGIIHANAQLAYYDIKPDEPLAPIRIFINSGGGSLDDAFSLISVIKASAIPIYTIALGECSSSALMIAMSGDYRIINKFCGVLSHQFSLSVGMVKHVDMKSKFKDIDLTAQKIVTLYKECTELEEETITTELLLPYDVYLTAADCIKYNMFDDQFESFLQVVPLNLNNEEVKNDSIEENA